MRPNPSLLRVALMTDMEAHPGGRFKTLRNQLPNGQRMTVVNYPRHFGAFHERSCSLKNEVLLDEPRIIVRNNGLDPYYETLWKARLPASATLRPPRAVPI